MKGKEKRGEEEKGSLEEGEPDFCVTDVVGHLANHHFRSGLCQRFMRLLACERSQM